MKAYKNNPGLKAALLVEIEKHRAADQIIQGTYGKEIDGIWRGCSVGCAIISLNKINGTGLATNDHAALAEATDIPEWLWRLNDTIFEGLPKAKSFEWPGRIVAAIPVGADVERVKWLFCAFILKENIDRVLVLDIPDDLKKQVVNAIRGVLALHERAITTGKWGSAGSAGSAAARSAYSAAGSAAGSAAAARSAYSAARSAYSAARSAYSAPYSVYLAAYSAAYSAGPAAYSAAHERYADKLIELLEAAPVPEADALEDK